MAVEFLLNGKHMSFDGDPDTPLLWVMFTATLLSIYLLTSWMPLLLGASGFSPRQAALINSLFQAGERSQPVSPAIHKLWGEQGSLVASAGPAATATSSASAPQGLDLFSDRAGTFSS